MATPARVAERDKISKQAVTKMVRRYVDEHDLPVERDERGRIAKFSLAHFDHLRGQFASSEKVAAARNEAPAQPTQITASNSRDEALRQEAWLKVTREKLRRQEDIGQLIRADQTRDALAIAGKEIQALVARLQNKADDLALAVTREGVHGLRLMLRQVSYDLNTEIADKLASVMLEAAEHDELLEGDEL